MRQVTLAVTSLLALTFLLLGLTPLAAQTTGSWAAEYYANAMLVGPLTLSQIEVTPTHNWGEGSPAPGLPADNFSARWSSFQTLNAGTYRLSVRADDGVRVVVNGVIAIDEWHPSPGNIYTTTLTLATGQHSFIVEYFDATGSAYLQYDLIPIGAAPPPTGATATVTTPLLNVRNAPNPVTGAIVTRISQGQTYPVLGRNADSSWLQLHVNGIIGWVNSRFVTTTNLQNVPVTDVSTQPTGAMATVTAFFLNVRNAPNPFTGAILTRIRRGETYPVVGRNADSSWLQLNVNGTIGWVNRRFVSAANLQNVPATDPSTNPSSPALPAPTPLY